LRGKLIGNVAADATPRAAATSLHQQHLIVIRVLKGVCIIISCGPAAGGRGASFPTFFII